MSTFKEQVCKQNCFRYLAVCLLTYWNCVAFNMFTFKRVFAEAGEIRFLYIRSGINATKQKWNLPVFLEFIPIKAEPKTSRQQSPEAFISPRPSQCRWKKREQKRDTLSEASSRGQAVIPHRQIWLSEKCNIFRVPVRDIILLGCQHKWLTVCVCIGEMRACISICCDWTSDFSSNMIESKLRLQQK